MTRHLAPLGLLALIGVGCSSSVATLVGKECDDAHPCPGDMTCVPTADDSKTVCVMSVCVDAADCVAGYTCTDGTCLRDYRPLSDKTTRLGDGAALGRGASQNYRVRVRAGHPAPAAGTSKSYRVTGISEFYSALWQLKPRLQTDLVEIFPPELMLEVRAPYNALPGETIPYTLPSTITPPRH